MDDDYGCDDTGTFDDGVHAPNYYHSDSISGSSYNTNPEGLRSRYQPPPMEHECRKSLLVKVSFTPAIWEEQRDRFDSSQDFPFELERRFRLVEN